MTATATTLLGEALVAWRYTREGVIAEVENIPADKFGYKPTAENRTVDELVLHIVQSDLMMSGELARPDGDFQRQSYPDFQREYGSDVDGTTGKDNLLELLARTHKEGSTKIERAGELHMLQFIRQFDGSFASRLSWMYHGIAHEEYHRGQIALYARQLGCVPALTQLIYGA
jgi:uncharacterized damage-inducible protein DinB